MRIFNETHAATNVGAGSAVDLGGIAVSLKTHTVEFLCDSGTGSATVTHYGRTGDVGSWHAIWTYTFTGAASGEKASQTLQHAFEDYKTECSAISGTGARVISTLAGA